MSFLNLFKKSTNKEPTFQEKFQIELQRAEDLSFTINNTCDFEEFINSYNELIDIFRHLSSYEFTGIFTGMPPSENLAEINKKRPLVEKAFLDRYVGCFGKSSLSSKLSYIDKFSLQATTYAKSIIQSVYISPDSLRKKTAESTSALQVPSGLLDPYTIEAGLYLIEKDRVSIGMIQRMFQVTFNRACKIMDQLYSLGLVSEDVGIQPRRILMSADEFKQSIQHLTSTLSDNSELLSENFDSMDGLSFENYCAKLLLKNGFYNIEVTQTSADHGIDILAEKDDISYAIQCKCYSSNIGNAAVQQAHTGKSIYHKDIAVVLTNQYFTEQAKEEASMLGVKLWDRNKLITLINSAK